MKKRKNKPFCKLLNKEISFSCCQECDNKEYKTRKNVKIDNKKSTIFVKSSTFYKKNAQNNRKTVQNSLHNSAETLHKMKNKSNKLAKLERKRYSVFTSDDKCFVCKSTDLLTWNEIYRGRNRSNSMKYGFCLRMCLFCHELKQEDADFNAYWHQKAQMYWEIHIGSREQFIAVFRKNYLD